MDAADKKQKTAQNLNTDNLKNEIKEYNIIDIKTKQKVGGPYKFNQRNRARAIAERKNQQYGAHQYMVQPVFERNSYMKSAARKVVATYLRNSSDTQLSQGIKVEKEHEDLYNLLLEEFKKNDMDFPLNKNKFFELIAKAHLKELPDYYTRLKKIEKDSISFSERK